MNALRILIAAMILASPGFLLAQDSSPAGFEYLQHPGISNLPNQKMLVVEIKGDPNVVGSKAFGLLFQVYYSMKETPQGRVPAIPRARWPASLDTAKAEWTGRYALPVPENVTNLPPYQADKDLKVSLTQWEYGEVAELLHVGPYSKEAPTLRRLNDFIKQQGYVTIGGHEEEYIKGPGMNGGGDPEKYLTILRYRVKKAGDTHN